MQYPGVNYTDIIPIPKYIISDIITKPIITEPFRSRKKKRLKMVETQEVKEDDASSKADKVHRKLLFPFSDLVVVLLSSSLSFFFHPSLNRLR